MPGRQAHGRPLTAKPKLSNKSKGKKRALDAFAVASHQVSDNPRIKQHRLGAREGGERPGKRRRDEDEDEDESEDEEVTSKKQKKGAEKGRFDELDLDEGSDSEGNQWKLGQVDSDDDSDLDSDEAFGESDEERFEGFAFSGSTDKKAKKRQNGAGKDLNLDEDDEEESDSELEEGDLGEGAVDLADMLNSSSEEDEPPKKSRKDKRNESDESDSDDESVDVDSDEVESDQESSPSSEDEDDDVANPHKIAALQSMIQTLSQADAAGIDGTKKRRGGLSLSDPTSQPLASNGKVKKSKAPLAVPLERRQQDRLDRSAAYDKSKETLGRWTETVKHNREAEHLVFPLLDNDVVSAKNNVQLMPTTQSKPFNDLEATIQSILEESGLATTDGKDDEDHLREFEELEANKMSLEEAKARRDQLRMARELLFREEAKSKRIKKIKSRAYRKVHRKQREKEERANQEALAEGGYEMSEDELEKQDRRRAEERMGGKHKNSKWAKAMKESGRTAWDTEVMSGVTEMARKDEQLRKRVEGKVVRKEFEDDSNASSDGSDDESEDDSDAEKARLIGRLQKEGGDHILDESAPGARLANLKFMKKAEASRKMANDEMVESLRKELAGQESESEAGGDIGRRLFGPAATAQKSNAKTKARDNFEEAEDSDTNARTESQKQIDGTAKLSAKSTKSTNLSSVTSTEATRRRHKRNNDLDITIDLSQNLSAAQPKLSKSTKTKKKSTQTLDTGSGNDSGSEDESTIPLPFAIKDQELIKRAFAGADVVGEFEDEKRQTVIDEDEKVVDNTIPGWGSWTGDGLSKKEKARNKGRFLTKSAGIKAGDRKDAKLERVIVNEKKIKKVGRTIASVRDCVADYHTRMGNTWLLRYRIRLRREPSMRGV